MLCRKKRSELRPQSAGRARLLCESPSTASVRHGHARQRGGLQNKADTVPVLVALSVHYWRIKGSVNKWQLKKKKDESIMQDNIKINAKKWHMSGYYLSYITNPPESVRHRAALTFTPLLGVSISGELAPLFPSTTRLASV